VTTYEPYPTVTFNGTTTYANNTISSIRIAMGRNDVTQQPQPGYASLSLWTDANTPLNVELSQPVSISIDKGTSGTQEIFYGTISDIEISLDAYGNQGSIATYNITAVGPLAQLNRHMVGVAGYAKEFDGTRILNILQEAFGTQWQDLSATLTWSAVPVGTTWQNYDAIASALVDNLSTNIDVPGQYELMAYTGGTTNAYDLVVQAANSGRGVLWEGNGGDLHYDDYAARIGSTPLTLTADDLSTGGLVTRAQWGEIVNTASVTYRAGTNKASDDQSVILYGELNGSRDTQLHNSADATNQAKDFVASRAYPRTYPELLTIPLHAGTVSDATRDSLCAVTTGLRVNTTALPSVFGTSFDGFVEGYTWNLTRYTADLALTCSAYSETYSSIVWYQISPTTTWTGYTPSTDKWMDL
jgi:hypothetical protein